MNQRERREMLTRHETYAEKDRKVGALAATLGHYSSALYAYTQINNKRVTEKEVYETYNFIVSMFKLKGFDEREAQNYLSNEYRKQILSVKKSDLVSTLSILNLIDLDEEALFESPSLLSRNYNHTVLYKVVKEIKKENLPRTLENIKALILQNISNSDDKYKEKIAFLSAIYEGNINKKLASETGIKKTLK